MTQTNRPGVVFDTNVIVSALLIRDSLPRRAFDRAWREGEILVSEPTLIELVETLQRPRLARYITETERWEFLAAFLREARLVPVTVTVRACRDPKDDKFLELALSGQARYLVTGDKDLLELHPFQGIDILTPRAFIHLPALTN